MTHLAAIDLQASLLGVAACVSAVGGCIASILAIRKSRDEETETCIQRLKECRAEEERMAAELHELKMKHEN